VKFQRHYTPEQARALLPKLRGWLDELVDLRDRLAEQEEAIAESRAPGTDLGGPEVNAWIKVLADFRSILFEFHQREILIKDLERGLIDFPAIHNGREVFLCWEKTEDDIAFWHDLDAGFPGREPL
jgi:hypothetical protein